MRRVAGGAIALAMLAACTSSVPRPASTKGERTVVGGIHTKYSHDQTRRHEILIKQTLIARGPQIETTPRVSELKLTVEERVFAPQGAEPSVSVSVVDAVATGPDAEIEKAVAIGRSFETAVKGNTLDFDLGGRQIGKLGELRMSDVALISYLLTPVSPDRNLPSLKKKASVARADMATIPPGWSAEDLRLAGSTRVVDRNPFRGHRAITVTNSHNGTAQMDLAVFDDATPNDQKFDPVTNGFFGSLFRSDPAINNSPLRHLFLAPIAVIDVFTFVFGCIFTLGFFPGCEDDTEQNGHVTIDMTGPISFTQTATIHAEQGLPIESSGKGSIKLEGRFPEPPSPPPGSRQAKGARTASGLASAPIAIEATWEISQKLVGPIPDDGLWWLPLAAAALGALAVVGLIVAWATRRGKRRAAAKS